MTVVALTGVPGTGKTTVAKHIDSHVTVLDAGELAREVDAVVDRDPDRDADVVDEALLAERAPQALDGRGDVLVEGLLAHHCRPDAVVLLRCHPDELRARLEPRDWPPEKVEENVMAETIDAIAPEITTEPAWEVDTTEIDPADVAERIADLFTGESLDGPEVHPLGGVDWTDLLLDEGPP